MNGVLKNKALISPREKPQVAQPNGDAIETNKKATRIFRELVEKNRANTLTMQEFNDFLCNPAVKRKLRKKPIFSIKVKDFYKQIIEAAANTIAAINQELFLNIQESELLSPWAYQNSPTLQANSDQYNNLANAVCRDILQASLMEERTLIAERWIWIARYLFEEHKDYSGSMAILVAFSRIEISRLNKTLAGLSKEAQEGFGKLSEILLDSNALRPVLNTRGAVIPAMPLIQRDITFLHDGNCSVSSLADCQDKSAEIAFRTGGGKKLMLAFNKLQQERRHFPIPNERNVELDNLLKGQLGNPNIAYNSKQAYGLSQQLEPRKNELKIAKPFHFGKMVKSSKSSQPRMREVILEELMHDLNQLFAHGVSTYLQARGQSNFQIGRDYTIDWQKENQQLEQLSREVEAYIEALYGYRTNLKKNPLLKQANALIAQLQSLNLKQFKMQNLEDTLSAALYKLSVEFGILEKLKPEPSNSRRIREIEVELNKISRLRKDCEFSPTFSANLALFKSQIDAFKQFASRAMEDVQQPITDWRKRELEQRHASRCRYSLYNQSRLDTRNEDSPARTVIEFF